MQAAWSLAPSEELGGGLNAARWSCVQIRHLPGPSSFKVSHIEYILIQFGYSGLVEGNEV